MNLSTTIAFGSCKPHEQTTTRKLLMILPDHDISSSLTTRTPLSYSSSSNQYSHRHQLKSSSSPRPLAVKEKKQLRRREFTIGFGLLLGVVDAFQLVLGHPQQAAAQAQAQKEEEEFTVTSSGLQFFDQVIGTGPQPSKGQLIKAHYIGKLENGVIFDSSYSRGKPLTFRVGVGEVIKGWDQGILGGDGIPPMLPGGKRSLKLPPELGYGVRGAGCKGGSCIIPPNSTLLFQVELIGKA